MGLNYFLVLYIPYVLATACYVGYSIWLGWNRPISATVKKYTWNETKYKPYRDLYYGQLMSGKGMDLTRLSYMLSLRRDYEKDAWTLESISTLDNYKTFNASGLVMTRDVIFHQEFEHLDAWENPISQWRVYLKDCDYLNGSLYRRHYDYKGNCVAFGIWLLLQILIKAPLQLLCSLGDFILPRYYANNIAGLAGSLDFIAEAVTLGSFNLLRSLFLFAYSLLK